MKINFKKMSVILLSVCTINAAHVSYAKSTEFKKIDEKTFVIKPNIAQLEQQNQEALTKQVAHWCQKLHKAMKQHRWKFDPCTLNGAEVGGLSVKGHPLVYFDYGDKNADNTTLILSMVHPDEITPLYVGLRTIQWVKNNIGNIPNTRVIVAPLVNPDGYYLKRKTRTNIRGVDLNRNFHTADFDEHAIKVWKRKYRAIKRRFPGNVAHSEPETIFQRNLIFKFKPNKILSLHAPLNFMDYDGPNVLTLKKFPKEYVKECLKLRSKVNAVSGGFFVGSLGNYAGQERGIPTLTLELPTADARKANHYWKEFKTGIKGVIQFRVPNYKNDLGGEAKSLVLRM